MKELECPYCGEFQEVDHDDGAGYEEDQTEEQECGDCGKRFVYTTGIIYSYTSYKADCLNDGKHDYKPTHTFPKELSRMRCTMCEEERSLTQEEKNKLLNTNPKEIE